MRIRISYSIMEFESRDHRFEFWLMLIFILRDMRYPRKSYQKWTFLIVIGKSKNEIQI